MIASKEKKLYSDWEPIIANEYGVIITENIGRKEVEAQKLSESPMFLHEARIFFMKNRIKYNTTNSWCGGMAYARHLKCRAGNSTWVRLPPPAPNTLFRARFDRVLLCVA